MIRGMMKAHISIRIEADKKQERINVSALYCEGSPFQTLQVQVVDDNKIDNQEIKLALNIDSTTARRIARELSLAADKVEKL